MLWKQHCPQEYESQLTGRLENTTTKTPSSGKELQGSRESSIVGEDRRHHSPPSSLESKMSPPLPSSGHFIRTSRTSCHSIRRKHGIQVHESNIDSFLTSLSHTTFEQLKTQHGLSLPITFSTASSEINFLGVLSLLNTLSAYRSAFHASTGKGAYENMVKLCVGLYEAAEDKETALDANALASCTSQQVAELWGVEVDSDLAEPINLAVQCCNGTGEALQSAGYTSIGQLAIEALSANLSLEDLSEHFIERIVSIIPGFFDATQTSDEPVYLFKKAYFYLFSLWQRFVPRLDELPKGCVLPKDLETLALPMFVDNVIPTMSAWLGLVELKECDVPALRSWSGDMDQLRASEPGVSTGKSVIEGPRLTAEEAYIVRAACLDAGTLVVKRAKELAQQRTELAWLQDLTEVDLDGYLWAVAKADASLRRVPRLVERGTIMY